MEHAGQEHNLRIQRQAVLKQSKQIKSLEKMIYFFLYATTNSFNFLILLPNLAHILSNASVEFTHIWFLVGYAQERA